MSHSVKFSWFLSESSVLTVEIKDRNLVLALFQKIPGSAGNKYRFSLQLYTRKHGFKYAFSKICWGEARPAPPQTSPLLNLGLRHRFGLCPQYSGALRPRLIRASPSIFTPSNMCINPSPNRRGLNQTLFPNSNISFSPNISFQEYVVGFRYTIEKIIDSRLGEFLENPLELDSEISSIRLV